MKRNIAAAGRCVAYGVGIRGHDDVRRLWLIGVVSPVRMVGGNVGCIADVKPERCSYGRDDAHIIHVEIGASSSFDIDAQILKRLSRAEGKVDGLPGIISGDGSNRIIDRIPGWRPAPHLDQDRFSQGDAYAQGKLIRFSSLNCDVMGAGYPVPCGTGAAKDRNARRGAGNTIRVISAE